MTTLADRPNSALLVIDLQNGVVERAFERSNVLKRVAALVNRARSRGVPVVWVQHTDTQLVRGEPEWQLAAELSPEDGEPIVAKEHGDAFEATDLEAVLSRYHVGHLIVVGAETDACIMATLHGAFVRGYDVTLVGDGHTTNDATHMGAPPPDGVIAHTNLYWGYHTGPGRTAAVVAADAIDFGAA